MRIIMGQTFHDQSFYFWSWWTPQKLPANVKNYWLLLRKPCFVSWCQDCWNMQLWISSPWTNGRTAIRGFRIFRGNQWRNPIQSTSYSDELFYMMLTVGAIQWIVLTANFNNPDTSSQYTAFFASFSYVWTMSPSLQQKIGHILLQNPYPFL